MARIYSTGLHTFESDDRVKLVKLGGDKLEGKIGTVTGVAIDIALARHYIVTLDEPTVMEHLPDFGLVKAISMTEHCLELIPSNPK